MGAEVEKLESQAEWCRMMARCHQHSWRKRRQYQRQAEDLETQAIWLKLAHLPALRRAQ